MATFHLSISRNPERKNTLLHPLSILRDDGQFIQAVGRFAFEVIDAWRNEGLPDEEARRVFRELKFSGHTVIRSSITDSGLQRISAGAD